MAHTDTCEVQDPDNCYGCKLAYMRENGGLTVQYPYGGRETFHGPTIRERAAREVATAASKGVQAVPKTNIYTGP